MTPSVLRRIVVTALTAGAAAVALAGCAGGAPTPTTSTVTDTVTVTPTTTPTPSPTPTPTGDAGCLSSSLTASAGDTPGGGAAGSFGVRIVLTNTGSADCYLQGWPGISLVGDGNGTQIGQPSDFDDTSPNAAVTLAAGGGTAYVDVRVAEAGNYSADQCGPTATDGFRIYPPGETNALFAAKTGITGCTSTDVHLLTSGAMQPGS